LNGCDEIDGVDSEPIFETAPMFRDERDDSNQAEKQLELLRSRIFEAVRVIRDMEVEENDDSNLISMVTSLSEECSALRQEVSYLRNVRQEKKRAWNKLQCFIMDAERKLKGSTSIICDLRDVIREMNQMISSSETSSLDETIMYMYNNQLERLEKVSNRHESISENVASGESIASNCNTAGQNYEDFECEHKSVSTQTVCVYIDQIAGNSEYCHEKCDIGVQAENVLEAFSSKTSEMFETFQEISREIYVVPEVSEESDSCLTGCDEGSSLNDSTDRLNVPDNFNEYEVSFPCETDSVDLSDDTLLKDSKSEIFIEYSESEIADIDSQSVNALYESQCEIAVDDSMSETAPYEYKCEIAAFGSNSESPIDDSRCETLLEVDIDRTSSCNSNSKSTEGIEISADVHLPASFSELLSKHNFGHFVVPFNISKKTSKFFNISDILFTYSDSKSCRTLPGQTCREVYSLRDAGMNPYTFFTQDISYIFNSIFYNMLKDNVKSVEICDEKNNWSCIFLNSKNFPLSLTASDKSAKCLPYHCTDTLDDEQNDFLLSERRDVEGVGNFEPVDEVIPPAVSAKSSILYSMPNVGNDYYEAAEDDFVKAFSEDISCPKDKDEDSIDSQQSVENNGDENIPVSISSSETSYNLQRNGTFVRENYAPARRQGTFIVESAHENQINEAKVCDLNLCYSAVVSAFVFNEPQDMEKKYVLYETCNFPDTSSVSDLQISSPIPESNAERKVLIGQHFVLCEEAVNVDHVRSVAPEISYHLLLLKAKSDIDKQPTIEHTAESSSLIYPLLPQYLPSDNYNLDNFECFSPAHSCEIYLPNSNFTQGQNDSENPLFIPKMYIKFKTLFSSEANNFGSQENMLSERMLRNNSTVPASLAFNTNNSLNDHRTTNNCEEFTRDVLNSREFSDIFPERKSVEIQTDNIIDFLLNQGKETEIQTEEAYESTTQEMDHRFQTDETFDNLDAQEKGCGLQADDTFDTSATQEKDSGLQTSFENAPESNDQETSSEVEIIEENVTSQQEDFTYDSHETTAYGSTVNTLKATQEYALREISLLDEIEALKDNLRQQNAVLQRLKEELEDTNTKLAEKEQQLEISQNEQKRLNDMRVETEKVNREIKKCQTEFTQVKYENLEKDISLLRQENLRQREKLNQQSNTIQSVKSQLCATISHLKHLKDTATKQMKRQKNQVLKLYKAKQLLHDTKIALEKKCEEIEKKNEMLSVQEFQLHEIQIRLDSTIEEMNKRSKESQVQVVVEKSNFATQTDSLMKSFDEKKELSEPSNAQVVILKRHSEELHEIQSKLQHLEAIFSNKREQKVRSDDTLNKANIGAKVSSTLKEGNIWKLLTISEQSYLSLMNKLSESLQIADLKGSTALMHSSWLNCDDLADARRQDHKKILQCLEKLKKNIRYLQETSHQEHKRQNVESISSDEKKPSFTCHSDEMHFQYLCEVLQKAQESLMKEYSQRKTAHHRTVITPGSVKTSRYIGSRERKVPLELKNGKILALLGDKLSHKELLPNKHDYPSMETKSGNTSTKSKPLS
ncbi:uncharacterized protein LOC118193825, partial [Stegodyphus dumicola]|uniref:uncharacterized protein LOC118193825 n=1 Tax=Stegodyphus dumicola TaxID=202533 RepID=UPI0015B1B1FE